jgi:serpin B
MLRKEVTMTNASSLLLLAISMLSACGSGNSTPLLDGSAQKCQDLGIEPPEDGNSTPLLDVSALPANEILSSKIRITGPAVSSEDATQLAADNLAFGVDLYGQLRAQNSGNFIFSQTSISLALAMLYGGAANTTAAQMATALHFTLPPERLHPAFNALDLALMAQPSGTDTNAFRLSIASSTWVQTEFSILASYLDLLAENYGAGLFIENFASSPETARVDINAWVSTQTEQMIPELFAPGSIDSSVQLVLANAVYFHGTWNVGFNPTSPNGTFHAPTRDISIPMMSNGKNNASLWSGTGWNAASLDYEGGTTSMILVVPDAGTFDAFEQGLTADGLASVLTPVSTHGMGIVTMPRFKFSTPSSLNSVLAALGMTDAFDPRLADLSGMDGLRDLSVGTVIHKAVIAVDEKGTTAAAATGAPGTTLIILESGPTLVVDRPFLFFIRHNPTGAILFQGRVVDPSQAQ